ncbi:SAF domain-containing protein [Streptomyces sp. NPDC020667]|uniref:SAF domain-containing protein n=1 Tax=Streptomyces sp. NPDC020667 TaxID=3154895 RepID=UPI00340416A0
MVTTKFAKREKGGGGAAEAPAGPLPITQDAPRRRRRPVVMGAGLALSAVGALIAVWMVNDAGDRVSVIATAKAIPAGAVIKPSDLVIAHVSRDAALHPVPVSQKAKIIGKAAAADIPAGILVTKDSVRDTSSLSQGKDITGILAKPGQLPSRPLEPGDEVTVVYTPTGGSGNAQAQGANSKTDGKAAGPDSQPAVVTRVGDADANGARVVDVATTGGSSATLAAWAASGSAAIVLKAKH